MNALIANEFGKDAPYKGKEDDLQIACIRYAKFYHSDLVIFHTPNGGSRNKIEAKKLKDMGVLAGVADIICLAPVGRFNGLVVELKVKGGSVTDHQQNFLTRCAQRGYFAAVCWSFEGWQQCLKNYLNGKGAI